MNNFIKKDFLKFEKIYFSCDDFSENNFYSLLDLKDVNEFLINCLNQKYFNDTKLDNIFKKNINELCSLFVIEKIDFSEFNYFKSEKDILLSYMNLFLLKVLSLKVKNSNFQKDEMMNSSFKDFFMDRNDFVNIFLDYFSKFFLLNEIIYKKKFFLNKISLRVFLFRFVYFYFEKKLILIKDIKNSNRHYKIIIFNLFLIPFIPEIVFFKKKFEVYIRFGTDPFIFNTHFISIFAITKQATYSNSTFKISFDQVNSLTQRSFFISKDLLLKNYKMMLLDLSLNEFTNLDQLYNDFAIKISKFINEKDLESLKIYHSKLSKILTLIRIKAILNTQIDNKELFLPFMFCFRGRIYELGSLSFTFYKEFRFCAYSGYYEEEIEKFHPINSQINNTLDDLFYLLKKYIWFENLTLIRKRACVWLFVSLGVMKKSMLGKKVHISTFLIKGIELWDSRKNRSLFSDVFEKIEYDYLVYLIEEIITSKILKKWIFWKDATASCFQHLLLILGERDDESYSICNLNSVDSWYDPYSYLLADFFEKKKKSFNNLNEKNSLFLDEIKFFHIFSRIRVKRVIMTESYGAGYKKLKSYFFLNLNLNDFSLKEKKEILEAWDDFFDYLSSENVLFAQSSKAINKSFKENNLLVITNSDKTEVDYSCFVIQIIQNEIYINKKRHTYKTRTITSIFDDSQFNTSLRANFVQARDAQLARKYIAYTHMWTVHDCFSIDFLNITYMVSVVNELMNEDFFDLKINLKKKKPIFSIFIIL